jgi:uncharacterized integral membrane protein
MAEIRKQPLSQTQPAIKQATVTQKNTVPVPALFTKDNYRWMAIGGIIIILGMLLMSGGKNQDPNTFNYNVVYSTTRVTVAPILIVVGLLVEIYAIFRKPKHTANA